MVPAMDIHRWFNQRLDPGLNALELGINKNVQSPPPSIVLNCEMQKRTRLAAHVRRTIVRLTPAI